jgi:hypothetical protein
MDHAGQFAGERFLLVSHRAMSSYRARSGVRKLSSIAPVLVVADPGLAASLSSPIRLPEAQAEADHIKLRFPNAHIFEKGRNDRCPRDHGADCVARSLRRPRHR